MKIDHNSPVPFHYQVEQLLRELIQKEDYQNGKLLPREVDLANHLGISRNTVRQAINKLVFEGLVQRKKGIGTKVEQKRVTTQLDNWAGFTQEMTQKGIRFTTITVDSSVIPADENLADIFNIEPGRNMVKLERLRGMGEKPVVYFVSYFHPRLSIRADTDFSGPLYELLERDYGVRPAVSREEIAVRTADAFLAEKLKVKTGDPLLYRKRLVLDPGKRLLEYNLGWYRSDRFTYSIEIRRES